MPKKPTPKFESWTYSKWLDHSECPLRAKLAHIERRPQKKGPALLRGQDIHNEADAYVTDTKSRSKRVPQSLDLFEHEFKELRELYREGLVDAEQLMAFDKTWLLLDDPWKHPSTWFRVKTDATVLLPEYLKIVDYKTGKVREDGYIEQLELYAASAFHAYDDVHEVRTELWFLDHGEIRGDELRFYPDDGKRLQKTWEKRVRPMMADRRFPPKPGGYCRWCTWSRAKGGPCEF